MRDWRAILVGLGLWGLSLALIADTFIATALRWIGEMIIWVGGTVVLLIGSLAWLFVCLIASIAAFMKLEDWLREMDYDDE